MGRDVVAHLCGLPCAYEARISKNTRRQVFAGKYPFKGEIKVLFGHRLVGMGQLISRPQGAAGKTAFRLEGRSLLRMPCRQADRGRRARIPRKSYEDGSSARSLGGRSLRWPYKTDCCGGSLA